jgi:hypothetical protein
MESSGKNRPFNYQVNFSKKYCIQECDCITKDKT